MSALRPLPHSAVTHATGSWFQCAAGSVWRSSADASGRFAIRDSRSAFTLVEMMAVIAVIGLLVFVTIPAVNSIRGSNVVVAGARQFANDMDAARMYAITRNERVRIVFATQPRGSAGSLPDTIPSSLPELMTMNCRAYAIMSQTNLYSKAYGGGTSPPANQPDLPSGQEPWGYLRAWTYLPAGVLFDPSDEDFTSSDDIALSGTSLFGSCTLNRVRLPFPDGTSKSSARYMAYIEFRSTGTPTLPGTLRFVVGMVDTEGNVTVHGRGGSGGDPAGFNSVVLSWDNVTGKVKWTQPGS